MIKKYPSNFELKTNSKIILDMYKYEIFNPIKIKYPCCEISLMPPTSCQSSGIFKINNIFGAIQEPHPLQQVLTANPIKSQYIFGEIQEDPIES